MAVSGSLISALLPVAWTQRNREILAPWLASCSDTCIRAGPQPASRCPRGPSGLEGPFEPAPEQESPRAQPPPTRHLQLEHF